MHPPTNTPNHHHGETTGRVLWLTTGLTLTYAGVEAEVGWWADRWRWWPTPDMGMDKLKI